MKKNSIFGNRKCILTDWSGSACKIPDHKPYGVIRYNTSHKKCISHHLYPESWSSMG